METFAFVEQILNVVLNQHLFICGHYLDFFLLPFLSSAHEHYTRYATNNVKFYTLFYFSIFESKISCDTITIFTVNCLGMLVCIDKYLIFRTVRCTMKVNWLPLCWIPGVGLPNGLTAGLAKSFLYYSNLCFKVCRK